MEQVLQQFCLDGTPVSCEPFGNGHINRTFRVTCSSGRVYTLQRINRVAFRHPEELIENIDAVSRFIAKKNTGLEMIRLCTARGGRKYAVDAQGEFWRAYDYISGGLSLEAPRDCNDFYQAAVAFGKFQQALADFPAATLHETIPRFHDTEDRLCQLRASVEADACGHALTENEISVLPLGAKIITIELGMRFLKDYLDGDVYFKIDRPTQNLDRCRAQLRLAADMEAQWPQMQQILLESAGSRCRT